MLLFNAHGNLFILTARAAVDRGAVTAAEVRYKQALAHCRKHSGRKSAAYGLLLIELSSFYESQRRHEESDCCWQEAREILAFYYLMQEEDLLELQGSVPK